MTDIKILNVTDKDSSLSELVRNYVMRELHVELRNYTFSMTDNDNLFYDSPNGDVRVHVTIERTESGIGFKECIVLRDHNKIALSKLEREIYIVWLRTVPYERSAVNVKFKTILTEIRNELSQLDKNIHIVNFHAQRYADRRYSVMIKIANGDNIIIYKEYVFGIKSEIVIENLFEPNINPSEEVLLNDQKDNEVCRAVGSLKNKEGIVSYIKKNTTNEYKDPTDEYGADKRIFLGQHYLYYLDAMSWIAHESSICHSFTIHTHPCFLAVGVTSFFNELRDPDGSRRAAGITPCTFFIVKKETILVSVDSVQYLVKTKITGDVRMCRAYVITESLEDIKIPHSEKGYQELLRLNRGAKCANDSLDLHDYKKLETIPLLPIPPIKIELRMKHTPLHNLEDYLDEKYALNKSIKGLSAYIQISENKFLLMLNDKPVLVNCTITEDKSTCFYEMYHIDDSVDPRKRTRSPSK